MLLLCVKWNIFSLLIHALSTSMRSSHVLLLPLLLIILALCSSLRFVGFSFETLSRFRAQFRIRHRCCHRLPLTIRKMERDRQILFSLCVCVSSRFGLSYVRCVVCYGRHNIAKCSSHVFFFFLSSVFSLFFPRLLLLCLRQPWVYNSFTHLRVLLSLLSTFYKPGWNQIVNLYFEGTDNCLFSFGSSSSFSFGFNLSLSLPLQNDISSVKIYSPFSSLGSVCSCSRNVSVDFVRSFIYIHIYIYIFLSANICLSFAFERAGRAFERFSLNGCNKLDRTQWTNVRNVFYKCIISLFWCRNSSIAK